MTRVIAAVTGSRAEFGLLRPVLQKIKNDPELTLKLYVTGMHIESIFGQTIDEITGAGLEIEQKVDIFLQDDSRRGVARSTALSMMGFADLFDKNKPDMLLVLGDRFEIFGAVSAACICGVPIAHIHGGELTEGVIDEQFRHCITKMSHLHFASTNQYRDRIIQMGEQPDMVFNTGSPSVDAVFSEELLPKDVLEQELNISFADENLLVTFHPAATEDQSPKEQFAELLKALRKTDAFIIFTYANADSGGKEINSMIEKFVAENRVSSAAFPSLGHKRYLSVMNLCSGLVGNSSSGLIEAAVLKKGAVNIGIRQQGRVRGENVIDCGNSETEISEALTMLFSEGFKNLLKNVSSPYGEGNSAERIVEKLKKINLKKIQIKRFHDLEKR
ncbi:MAG: UDP-N-acetylglucosamine 2-epimerase (hydrolyzing) [Denitrovibrio sp.]|nr:MAG: UDP-N-acetylglucosamine 2-epimerase (hydrolyzing) [Denitrovibrio sp.]